ncbi:MAG: hypothetical protein EOP87_04760 [Verrucomicrobiaceae bacterium]|nr:MAG: hypothetical protein EOP87_04760 [Verrucomicrobiaceae bacterium]
MKASIAITLAILTAASLMGWRNQTELARATHALENARQQARDVRLGGEPSDNTTRRTRPQRSLRTDSTTLAKDLIALARELETASGASDSSLSDEREERMNAHQRRLLALDPEEMNHLIGELRDAPDLRDESKQEILLLVFQSFTESHPHAALEAISGSPDLLTNGEARASAITSALVLGMENDFAASTAWFRNNRGLLPGDLEGRVAARVMPRAALIDPEAAFKLIGNFGSLDPEYAIRLVTGPAKTIDQRDATLAAFRDYLTTVEDPALREKLHKEGTFSMIGNSLGEGVDGAIEKLGGDRFTPEELGAYASMSGFNHNRHDTAKWLAWLQQNVPAETMSSRIIPRQIDNWTHSDYRAVGEWLEGTEDGPVKTAAAATYAGTIARNYPSSAARWALTLPPGDTRDRLLPAIYKSWLEKDPAAAAVFADQNGIPK